VNVTTGWVEVTVVMTGPELPVGGSVTTEVTEVTTVVGCADVVGSGTSVVEGGTEVMEVEGGKVVVETGVVEGGGVLELDEMSEEVVVAAVVSLGVDEDMVGCSVDPKAFFPNHKPVPANCSRVDTKPIPK